MRWHERRTEEDLNKEEEIGLWEDADPDPRKEKEDPMSPRRELLWQSMCVMLAQPEMQAIVLQSPTSLSTASKENVWMQVMLEKPFVGVWKQIGMHCDQHWKSAKQIQLPAKQMQRKPNFRRARKRQRAIC